jgi:hypothetical protein
MAVMHDLVADIDGRPELLQGPLDDLDRPLDTGTKAARFGQNHFHRDRPVP